MNICRYYNATIANLEYKNNAYYTFDKETKTYSGVSAHLTLDFFLLKRKRESQKDFFKHCNFVTSHAGRILENGTYDGLFSLLIENKADFILILYNMFMDQNKVDFSSNFGDWSVVVSHFFNQTKSKIDHEALNYSPVIDLFIPDITFFIGCILLFFISWIAISLLYIVYRKYFENFSFKLICLNVLHLKDNLMSGPLKGLSCFKIVLLFNSIFLFFVTQILENNVNSSKIIVNKEILIYNKEKIYTTNSKRCWLANDDFKNYFKNSPKGSFEHFIWKKSKNDCYLTEENNVFNYFRNYFVICYKYRIDIYMRIISNLHKDEDLFISKNGLLSLNLVMYISKSTNKLIKNEINKWAVRFTELGYHFMFGKKYSFIMGMTFPTKGTVYESVSQFVEAFTITDDLKYNYFNSFFYILLFIYALICFFFILSKIYYLFRND